MKIFNPRFKFSRSLFWLGPILTIMGISAGVVSGTWGLIPGGLIILGIVIIGLWLIFPGGGGDVFQPSFWRRRSTQASTNALVSTIAVLVILGLINFLGVRHSIRIDLTDAQLFTLSPESKQVLQELRQGVKVWVFSNEQNPQDRDLLENYQRRSNKFSFEFVDPEAQPGLAETFDIKNSGDNRDVYLELQSNQRRQFVQTISSQMRLSENRITNGIVQISSDRRIQVYFLQGHGEKSLTPGEGAISIAVKALEDKNFFSKPLNLAQVGKVPADAAVVLVMGPTRPLFAAEVKALEDFLDRGGNLLVAVDPNTKPEIDSLLKPWGVKFDDRVAINAPEQQVVGVGPAGLIVTQYGTHPITKDFRNNISFYPLARPIEINPVPGIQATPLLLTDPKSWAESNLKQQPLKLDGGDRPGPLAVGVALTRAATPAAASPSPSPSPTASPAASPSPSPGAKTSPSPSPSAPPSATKESRLVVLGNSAFAVDGFFGQQLNGDVFINSVNWLSQQGQQPLSIRPKDVKNRRITLTAEHASTLALIALAIVPLAGLSTAGVVWWRRR